MFALPKGVIKKQNMPVKNLHIETAKWFSPMQDDTRSGACNAES